MGALAPSKSVGFLGEAAQVSLGTLQQLGRGGGAACNQQGHVAAVTTAALLSSRANGNRKGPEVGAGDPSGLHRCGQTPSPSQIPCALPAPTGPRPSPGRTGPSRLSALAGGSPSCRVCPSGSRPVLVRTGPRTAPLFRRESIHGRVLRLPRLIQSFVFGPQWPSQPPCKAPGGLTVFPPGFCSQAGCLSTACVSQLSLSKHSGVIHTGMCPTWLVVAWTDHVGLCPWGAEPKPLVSRLPRVACSGGTLAAALSPAGDTQAPLVCPRPVDAAVVHSAMGPWAGH